MVFILFLFLVVPGCNSPGFYIKNRQFYPVITLNIEKIAIFAFETKP